MIKKTKYKINGEEKKYDSMNQLSKWQSRFDITYDRNNNPYDYQEKLYRGTKNTVANINSTSSTDPQKTNNVPNIVYQLIEAQVNTSTPDPIVKSMKGGFEDQAKMIQEKIFSDFNNLGINKMSDINERDTYMFGIAMELLTWNSNKGQHEYLGEKELVHYHPKQVVPQDNVHDIDKMDYFFLISTPTKERVFIDYGIDVDSETETILEANQLDIPDATTPGEQNSTSRTNDLVTMKIAFYIDKDGDIGKFTWVGNTVVEDKPKYYYPRVMECRDCGEDNPQGSEKCECGSKKLREKIMTHEIIDEKLELEPISYTTLVKKVEQEQTTDPKTGKTVKGEKFIREVTKTFIEERIVPKGTKIPIPVPKLLPLAVRKNVPMNFSFPGRSDVDTIKDQQESVKKASSKGEEKLLTAGTVITMPNGINEVLSNETYKVFKGNPEKLAQIRVVDIQTSANEEIGWVNFQTAIAEKSIGITPSFRGEADPSARSGKAKQLQINQTDSRFQSKDKNKMDFYEQIYRLMFYMDLCFTHEKRPYITTNTQGKDAYKIFDKHQLLYKDGTTHKEDGKDVDNWFYNTDFIFKAEMNANLPKDKTFWYEQVIALLQFGAIKPKELWQLLDKLGFPPAKFMLQQTEAQENELASILSILSGLAVGEDGQPTPDVLIKFMQMPVETQQEFIEQAKGGE
jgi:hypothetical protein